MAIRKVCGIETEYGILLRGAGDSNPIAASSVLINAYVAQLSAARSGGTSRTSHRAATPGGSWPTARCRPTSRPTSSTPCSPTAPATTSTTPTPRSPRPSAPTPARSCVFDQAAEQIVPPVDAGRAAGPAARRRDRRPQEQLRRQGQQLRLPRELPHGPRGAVRAHRRPGHAPLRHPPDLLRGRQGGLRGARASARADVPFQLSQRADFFEEEVGLETTLKRPDRQHPRRAALRQPEVPPPARDRR